jgi:multidrug efflux pump
MRGFTDVFIRKPVLALVVNIAIALIGARALLSLPIQQFPSLPRAAIIVSTNYTGASAETVRGFVTAPIERAITAISGVDHIESQSSNGFSYVVLRLKAGHDSTMALAEVTARLQQIRAELPTGALPPTVEIQRADRPYGTFYLGFTSKQRSIPELTDWLSRHAQPRFGTVPGVQRALVDGAPFAMRVWLEPAKLAAFNLTPADVREALQRNTAIAAVGRTQGDLVQLGLRADTELRTAAEFANIILTERGGAVVRLREVARVELGAEDPLLLPKLDDERCVYIGIFVLPGANDLEVRAALFEAMERLRPDLPADIEMTLAADGAKFTHEALVEIAKTLIETVLIVALVVYLFMGSIRTALVPLVAMPISLLGAAILMLGFGFSLNLLTILAMALSVGLVVDDAIVVVENVARHIREGKTRLAAALEGARELAAPIVAMTITLATVYAPLAFQGGLTGTLFLEFAITLAAAVVVSGVVALTLSPVMSAWCVDEHAQEPGAVARWIARGFDAASRVYSRLLDFALELRLTIAAATAIVACAALPLYLGSKQELAPPEDTSTIAFGFAAAPDSSLAATDRESSVLVRKLNETPDARFVWSFTAPSGGFGGLVFEDFDQRERSTAEMLGDVWARLSGMPSLQVYPRLDPPLPSSGSFDVEVAVLGGGSPEELQAGAQLLVAAAQKSGKFLYADTDLKIDLPQARVRLDRELLADLGLDVASVSDELTTLLGGAYVAQFDYFERSYKVIPQLANEQRASLQALMDLEIRAPDGQMIPVSSFMSIENTTEPRALNRFQQSNAARVFGAAAPGVTKDEALRVLEHAATEAAIAIDHAGQSREIREEGGTLLATMCFALLLTYLVLAAQFGSFRDPLIVLAGSVPLATAGALVTTYLDFTTLNIYSQVGLVTLVGLIAKNGILIVEFANTLRERGAERFAALRAAALTRLRPILMTSAATVFGHLPLVLATGPGAEARNSIGIVLVTGMLIGTFFTLLAVPVFYVLISRPDPQAVKGLAPV